MTRYTLIINGEPREVEGPVNAEQLLDHLGLDARMVVMELNEQIIRRPRLGDTTLADGDRIELVHFVGGG